jgi:diguanylate cyclase (GGDEF)-like protein
MIAVTSAVLSSAHGLALFADPPRVVAGFTDVDGDAVVVVVPPEPDAFFEPDAHDVTNSAATTTDVMVNRRAPSRNVRLDPNPSPFSRLEPGFYEFFSAISGDQVTPIRRRSDDVASLGLGHQRSRVRTRLLSLVLVPVIGVAVFGGREAYGRTRSAARADKVEERVDRATVVIEIRLGLARETFSTGALALAKHFGFTPTQIGSLLGVDLSSRRARDRQADDQLVAALIGPGDFAPVFSDLAAVRARIDAHPDDFSGLLAGMTKIQIAVANSGQASLQSADHLVFDAGASAKLHRLLSLLQNADDATIAVGAEVDSFAQLISPPSNADRQAALDQLRLASAVLKAAETDVPIAPKSIREHWEAAANSSAAMLAQREAVRIGALAPAQVPSLPITAIAPAIRAGMSRMDDYNNVALAVAAAARTEAAHTRTVATRNRNSAIAFAAALILAAIALAFAISRTISRPLRALARAAGRVSAGDLAAPLPPPGGPRELAAVRATLGEVVDNLRLVESQVDALAAERLADPVLDNPVPGRLGTLLHESVGALSRSISERERLTLQVQYDAMHDALTGLPNRTSALEALRQSIARSRRDGRGTAVLAIDLDGFKRVNDTHGHDAGDVVLQTMAERMRALVREGDVVARLGGDEFAILLEGVIEPRDVFELARRLVDCLSEPVVIGVAVTRVGASVGVALGLDAFAVAEDLLRGASLALDRAKQDGGNRVASFDQQMFSELVRRAEVEERLRDAIASNELELHYQPVVTTDLRAVGAEALVRWRRDGHLVMPDEFIPVAEASDLVIDLGRWVLRAACDQLRRWTSDPARVHAHVAVNLSRRHLLSLTVVDDVRAALESAGVEPAKLVIEITETALVDNFALAADHLDRLRELGVRIAIDDFGTGYTSLAHLRRLPADIIKLDRSLVLAAQEPADARVLALIAGAAHALGMQVVAEGIETAEQLELMRSLGVEMVQGFLISRPLPAFDLDLAA